MVFSNLFKRKPDLAALEKLDLPELPKLSGLDKKTKGKKGKEKLAAPPYMNYISSERHESDLKRMTKLMEDVRLQVSTAERSIKDIEHRGSEVANLRKDIESLKKVKFTSIHDIKKDIEDKLQKEVNALRNEMSVQNVQKELQEVREELSLVRADMKSKKGMNQLQEQLTRLESELQMVQKQSSKEDLKKELQHHIKSQVVQHVFESKYDPKQFRTMKKDVLSFIAKAIEAGHDETKVKNALVERGWPEPLVEAYYENVFEEKLKE